MSASDVARAFGELKLPAGDLTIQPPDGVTLVNFDTNFYTTSTAPLSRIVTLLGQQVTIEATPSQFRWNFGDGQPLTTTDPGAAYPDLTVTHNYERTGTYQVSLDTTYTGRFRVAGGAWQEIPSTVTITGTAQELTAIEATPTLMGY
ncbi:PKD domain-containing protein [Nocardioides sp. zg-ZUI104]|uniref:PKD domain-containing protein n=1 Tax=Nocardioides faecalis TaxID=2803858 RepID=UPI001BCE4FCA|nr:PKD domain-containing protein [Nocardioides faecalis]MBS4752249.1 PKD domain-containing protein [Nocardioides faecalis]